MNFFEQLLRGLTGKTTAFKSASPVFIGRACFLTLSEGRRARLEFITLGTADQYEALQVSVINLNDGKIDCIQLRFSDYFAPKRTVGGDARAPHIWVYQGKAEWYGEPAETEKAALSKAASDYVKLFT